MARYKVKVVPNVMKVRWCTDSIKCNFNLQNNNLNVLIVLNWAIYNYLVNNHPSIIEDEQFRPHDTAVISLPQKAPEGSTTRTEDAIQLLERVKYVATNWVNKGHTLGMNTHNVSATISIRKWEWDEVGNWMWNNRKYYNGLSVLPFDGGTYVQAPFESITRLQYEQMIAGLEEIDLTKIIETEDNTDLQGEIACAGGLCEIWYILCHINSE